MSFNVCSFATYIFFGEDDLLTCNNQQKNNTRAQCQISDNIFLTLMKQLISILKI